MPIGSDATIPLNTDPGLVPAQPAVSVVNPGFKPRAQPLVPLSQMPIPENPVPVSLRPQMGPFLPQQTQQPQQGNLVGGLMGFLASLFGNRGSQTPPPGPAQGMRGLLQAPVGRSAPGTNSLGNPFNRF